MSRYLLPVITILLLFSCVSQPPKADPQSTYAGTIQKAIELLENEDYEAIFSEIAHPGDIRDMTEDGETIEKLIDDFRGKPAEYLLTILKLIQNREPVLSGDGMRAEWEITEKDMEDTPVSPIILEKVDGKWYIRN